MSSKHTHVIEVFDMKFRTILLSKQKTKSYAWIIIMTSKLVKRNWYLPFSLSYHFIFPCSILRVYFCSWISYRCVFLSLTKWFNDAFQQNYSNMSNNDQICTTLNLGMTFVNQMDVCKYKIFEIVDFRFDWINCRYFCDDEMSVVLPNYLSLLIIKMSIYHS